MQQLDNYIIASNNIVKKDLELNIANFKLTQLESADTLMQHNKLVNLLIIDCNLDQSQLAVINQKKHQIRLIVNLAGKIEEPNFINITKPFSLIKLHNLIKPEQKEWLFISLGQETVYNQQKAIVTSGDKDTCLTDKENLIMASLIQAEGHIMSQQQLMKIVWQDYHADSQSNTAEVHLYRLKQKLPEGVLSITKEFAQLNLPKT